MKLEEFAMEAAAEKEGQHNRCKTCALPDELRLQVEKGRAGLPPVGWTMISRWLETEGHKISPPTLKNHFALGHVE